MVDSPAATFHQNISAGHLSVRLDPSGAAHLPFSFEQQQKRMGPAVATSVASHLVVVVLAIVVARFAGHTTRTAVFLPDSNPDRIIWLSQPGPGGGGGGGGNRMKEPPRQMELPGKDKITVPAVKPPAIQPPQQARNEPNPLERLTIPAKSLAAATESLPGAIEAPPAPPSLSQGSGSGGGAGEGTGTGIGRGRGSGLGDGVGGGTGGGVYQPGSGVSEPRLLFQARPNYTSDAMRAKVQGVAVVQCIVRTNGLPTDCQIHRSLDPTFGLDQEALKAARQWRFIPGTFRGEPVNVQVLIEMTFTLR